MERSPVPRVVELKPFDEPGLKSRYGEVSGATSSSLGRRLLVIGRNVAQESLVLVDVRAIAGCRAIHRARVANNEIPTSSRST